MADVVRGGATMWGGCRPAQGAIAAIGQPFSTGEMEPAEGNQARAEWPNPGAPSAATQVADAPRDVVMDRRQDRVMRGEPADWAGLMCLVPRQNPEVLSMTFDRETVLFDLSTGCSCRLNSVGTVVWGQCNGSATLSDIQTVLRSRGGLSLERGHDAMISVVLQLVHDGLLSTGDRADRAAA